MFTRAPQQIDTVDLRLSIKQALLDITGGVSDAQKEAPSGKHCSVQYQPELHTRS